MKHLTNLFKILELTRSMPQYGYVLSGVKKNELSNLAEHQYLVTFFAWQLALHLKNKGANINVLKVLEISLVHDVAELFGGDINFHYGRAHKSARQAAKAFEKENIEFMSKFFGDPKHFLELHSLERGEVSSDEAIVSRFADLVEGLNFKLTLNKLSKKDIQESIKDLKKRLVEAKDPIVKKELKIFLNTLPQIMSRESVIDVIWNMKD